jgi:hypothetical protein
MSNIFNKNYTRRNLETKRVAMSKEEIFTKFIFIAGRKSCKTSHIFIVIENAFKYLKCVLVAKYCHVNMIYNNSSSLKTSIYVPKT